MRLRHLLRILALLATTALSTAASAQSFRAYLSSTGSDSNPCTVSQPCRLLPAALNAIADGGEVWMLDSANFNSGTVNVTKSATILAIPGAVGSVVALGGPAVSIAAAGVRVVLRNLVIVPFAGGAGTDGVVMTDGSALTIENCVLSNMTGYNAVSVSTAAQVRITDTLIRNVDMGVVLSSGATAYITATKITGASSYGVYVHAHIAGSTTVVSVSDSFVSHSGVGVYLHQISTGIGKLIVSNTTATANIYGVAVTGTVAANAILSVGNSTVSANSDFGMYNSSGTMKSLGNNFVSDNGLDVSGAITAITPR
jgi:hypothetical protein